jgi:hypothetical protein
MDRVSLTDIIGLLGEGGLEDRFEERKARFRQFLHQDKWRPEDFAQWMHECLERASPARPQYYYAFQDLCVAIGHYLGTDVEFGSYSRSQDLGFDGRWLATKGRVILLEVKATPWPVPSVHQLGSYMDRYCVRYSMQPDDVLGLFVLGPGESLPLMDQVRGSEYRGRMKVAQASDLLRLWELCLQLSAQIPADRARAMVQGLLMPIESVSVGTLLDVVFEVARRSEEAAPEPAGPSGEEWSRSELVAALDRSAASRLAVLAALCVSAHEPKPAHRIVDLMRAAAERIPGLPKPEAITPRAFNGTMAAFARARAEQGKESFIENLPEGYCLSAKYRD